MKTWKIRVLKCLYMENVPMHAYTHTSTHAHKHACTHACMRMHTPSQLGNMKQGDMEHVDV